MALNAVLSETSIDYRINYFSAQFTFRNFRINQAREPKEGNRFFECLAPKLPKNQKKNKELL